MRITTKLSAVTVGASLMLTLAACSPPEGQGATTTAPQATGSLNIACSQQEDFCQAITAAFSAATGIDATYVRLGSGEVLARLETTPGEFDVWSGGQAENHLIADDRGFIEPYVSPNAAALAAEYNDTDGVWSGFYTDSVGFCSNKAELDKLGIDAPTSWDDLLDPALKGTVSMPHPATAGVGYMAMFAVDTLNGGAEDETIDYFRQLDENVLQYSKSAASGTELAGRGEVAVAISLDSDCVKAKEAGYSDLVTSYPEEGTGYEVGAVSILKDARNIDGAKAYMDWILSTDAQNLYADVPSYAAPTLADAQQGASVPDQDAVNKVTWDLQKAADSREPLLARFESDVASQTSATE
ncbi:ABC transporter substrate-binding protein [Herbiconiux sp. A18JL235]|uniref:ABC transporter substrate-binding protein n=1 Tax=Herbiconiux sp. A18JL235 TaxID=3152363 RepID=A0AB39BHQ7_9MICO